MGQKDNPLVHLLMDSWVHQNSSPCFGVLDGVCQRASKQRASFQLSTLGCIACTAESSPIGTWLLGNRPAQNWEISGVDHLRMLHSKVRTTPGKEATLIKTGSCVGWGARVPECALSGAGVRHPTGMSRSGIQPEKCAEAQCVYPQVHMLQWDSHRRWG